MPQQHEEQQPSNKTKLQKNVVAVHTIDNEDENLHETHKTNNNKRKLNRHIHHHNNHHHHRHSNINNYNYTAENKSKHSHKRLFSSNHINVVNFSKNGEKNTMKAQTENKKNKNKNSNNIKINDVNYFIQNEEYRVIGLGTVGLNASSVEPIHTLTMPCKQPHHRSICEHNVISSNNNNSNADHNENTEKTQIIPFYTPAFYRAEEPSFALRHATASEQEFKQWRERNLRHSLYHTYALSSRQNRELITQKVNVLKANSSSSNNATKSTNNNTEKTSGNTNINNTESDNEFEEKRIKAIAKTRAQEWHKRQRKMQEHELQLLTRREQKKYGKAVDLPLSYYTVIVEQNRQLMPIPTAPRKNRFEYKNYNTSKNYGDNNSGSKTNKVMEGSDDKNNNTITKNNVNSVTVYRDDIVSQFTPLPPDPSTLHKSVDVSTMTVKDHHKACQLAEINRQYVKSEIQEEKRADRQAGMKVIREQLEHAQQEQVKQKEKWMALHESNSRSAFEAKHAQEHDAAQQLALQNKLDHDEWVQYAEEIKRKEAEEELARRMLLRWQVFHQRPNHTTCKEKETTYIAFTTKDSNINSEKKEFAEHKAIVCQEQHVTQSPIPSPEPKDQQQNESNNNYSTFITTITPNAATTTNVYSELKKWIRDDDMAQEAKQLALLHNLSGSRLPSRDGQRRVWLDTLSKDRTEFNAQTVRDFKAKYPELIYRSLNEHFNNKTHLASTMREIHSANVERMTEWERDEDAYKSQLHRQQQRQEEKVNEVKTSYIEQLHHNAAATREEAKRNDELLHLIAQDEISALQMRVASARAS